MSSGTQSKMRNREMTLPLVSYLLKLLAFRLKLTLQDRNLGLREMPWPTFVQRQKQVVYKDWAHGDEIHTAFAKN